MADITEPFTNVELPEEDFETVLLASDTINEAVSVLWDQDIFVDNTGYKTKITLERNNIPEDFFSELDLPDSLKPLQRDNLDFFGWSVFVIAKVIMYTNVAEDYNRKLLLDQLAVLMDIRMSQKSMYNYIDLNKELSERLLLVGDLLDFCYKLSSGDLR